MPTNPELVLVTGGTGTLGRVVVRQLREAGRRVRVLSRRPAPPATAAVEWVVGDLRTGAALAEAVRTVDVVVHCATGARPRADQIATSRLIDALGPAGRAHLVYISIVGVDRIPLPYYRNKLSVERQIEASGLPWSALRATQFHDLVAAAFRLSSRAPVMAVLARTSFQPVAVEDVARRPVELAQGPAAGRVPDLGGPQVRTAAELAHAYLRATARRRPLLEVSLPGRTARGFREGHHLVPNCRSAGPAFEEWLASR